MYHAQLRALGAALKIVGDWPAVDIHCRASPGEDHALTWAWKKSRRSCRWPSISSRASTARYWYPAYRRRGAMVCPVSREGTGRA